MQVLFIDIMKVVEGSTMTANLEEEKLHGKPTLDWTSYVERLEHFFACNDIREEAKKRSTFLSVIGPGAYKLLRSLVSPDKPGDKEFNALVETLEKYYNPAPSEIVQRHKFHTRSREATESVSTYVSELRIIAENCNFGTTLDLMLRDRLVCGINDDAIQRRLLAESGLTFARALEIAQAMEAASRNMSELQRTSTRSGNDDIHRITRGRRDTRGRTEEQTGKGGSTAICHRCGKPGYSPINCRHRSAKCFNGPFPCKQKYA